LRTGEPLPDSDQLQAELTDALDAHSQAEAAAREADVPLNLPENLTEEMAERYLVPLRRLDAAKARVRAAVDDINTAAGDEQTQEDADASRDTPPRTPFGPDEEKVIRVPAKPRVGMTLLPSGAWVETRTVDRGSTVEETGDRESVTG